MPVSTAIRSKEKIEETFKARVLHNPAVKRDLEFVKTELGFSNISVPVLEVAVKTDIIMKIVNPDRGSQKEAWRVRFSFVLF